MADFGIVAIPTHYTIAPAELGKWAEAHGFESLWFCEHSHIPSSRKTPFPMSGELPEYYKQFFDPFIGLTAAAAATEKLKVGTSVCLVPEHNTMNLAKMVACLDRVSNGRFLFGIGGGWNAEEMADHGVEFKDRWQVTRERILALTSTASSRATARRAVRRICNCSKARPRASSSDGRTRQTPRGRSRRSSNSSTNTLIRQESIACPTRSRVGHAASR